MSSIDAAKKILDIKRRLQKAANWPVVLSINAWSTDLRLPPFFSVENGFSTEYRIDARGIGWEFSWKHFPGFAVFWLEHINSGSKACFGLNEDIENPRPRV